LTDPTGPPAPPTATAAPARRPPRKLIGPFSARQVVLTLVLIFGSAGILLAITRPLGSVGPSGPRDPRPTPFVIGSPTVGLQPGSLAPELAVDLGDGSTFVLQDLDGNPIRLADLRGKGVWINFFASWCPPCQSETPVLREVHEAYADRGLELVAVEVQETVDQGRQYAETYGLEYTIGADVSGHIFREYLVYALPTQIFIDPEGVIRGVVGAPLEVATARQWVESILPAD
jgi:thiol-disulfide isomerase/thioredoxin